MNASSYEVHCTNTTNHTTIFFKLIDLKKDHSMIETRRLKNVVIFIQTIRELLYMFENDDKIS